MKISLTTDKGSADSGVKEYFVIMVCTVVHYVDVFVTIMSLTSLN